ncbi:transcriptional regulator [Vibrio panuliri]|uniref:Transcriptional regulator n=1 Tax=Vibrio panuliri TaxID=1381081 RepID=A0A1Q9HNT3_9VIBR|nr:substrate-binding domain-containing protein [Vibrio panuliri]OLQ92477.1 transcriptional regulator [Vibrio panuliri]
MPQSKKKGRPSLKDIADKVGVTKMTVSRYMRNPESVSQATREKIAAVAEETGYIHNRAPQMLSKASSKSIGILLPSLSNQVFANFVQGIEAVTNARGYEVLITHYSYSDEIEESKVASLLSYQVDGLILTGTSHTPRTLQMIKTANVPVVEAMELCDDPIDLMVGLDHEAAAYEAVKLMISKGKKHIGYFGARLDSRTKMRMRGYDRAMVEHGLEKHHFLTHKPSNYTLGRELLDRALTECPDLDGVLCTNDDIAIGVVLGCQDRQIAIPEQLGVIGYNALNIGQAITPKLTSVYTPRYEIGEKSAEVLLNEIEGNISSQRKFDLGFTITSGDSL